MNTQNPITGQGFFFQVVAVGAALVLCAGVATCEVCNVPSATYPSIQSAVNVINCTEIVLTSGNFFGDVAIGRTLTLQGVSSSSTTILGKVTVSGPSTQATLKALKIAVGSNDLPYNGLVIVGEAVVLPDDLVIGTTYLDPADHIFSDGFERGDTTAWSNTVP